MDVYFPQGYLRASEYQELDRDSKSALQFLIRRDHQLQRPYIQSSRTRYLIADMYVGTDQV